VLETTFTVLLAIVAVATVWFSVFTVLRLYQGQR